MADAGICREGSEYLERSHPWKNRSHPCDLICTAVLVLPLAGDLALVLSMSWDARLDA
jgi:hypothetical protein